MKRKKQWKEGCGKRWKQAMRWQKNRIDPVSPEKVPSTPAIKEHTARPVLPKAPGVFKYATLQNLTLNEL